MKTLLVKKNSWWDQPGCSCCDSTEMPYYELYLDGNRVDTWTSIDREQALESFLETLGYEVEWDEGDEGDE